MLIILLSTLCIPIGMIIGCLMNGKGMTLRLFLILLTLVFAIIALHPIIIAFGVGIIFQSIIRWNYKVVEHPSTNCHVINLADYRK